MSKFKKFFTSSLLISLISLSSCGFDNLGFNQPMTLRMTVPDGPPEFKAGWYAGCKTGLSTGKSFANTFSYGTIDFGSGVYQHDPVYQSAWAQAYFNCITHMNNFVDYHSFKKGPLE